MNIGSIIVTEARGRKLAHKMIDKISDPYVRILARGLAAQCITDLSDNTMTIQEFSSVMRGLIAAAEIIVRSTDEEEEC